MQNFYSDFSNLEKQSVFGSSIIKLLYHLSMQRNKLSSFISSSYKGESVLFFFSLGKFRIDYNCKLPLCA